ncbi:MAG: hypothetical protein FWF94_00900 [Oscillospiraceae bacterium]|nr:hypothetical protein [Oscillospiraceae bacterium]
MPRKIDGLRMTMVDAMEKFPDEYILMCMDGESDSPRTGEVLYVGDKKEELKELRNLEDRNNCGVFGGVNLLPMFGGIMADGTS